MPSWMRMMLPPRRMEPGMPGQTQAAPNFGIPSGMAQPDQDYLQDNGLPQLDYSHLNDNVVMPSSVFGSSRLARGMDNALLSAATFKPGQTAGENISAVASNFIGLNPERAQVNFQRQLAPYTSQEPLARLNAELAMAQFYKDRGDYYSNGGRPVPLKNPVLKQDDSGNYIKVNPDGTSTPIMQSQTSHYVIPSLQVGNTTLPGEARSVTGQVPVTGPLPGANRQGGGTAVERLVNNLEQERVANGGAPFSAEERANAYMQIAGSITGSQTSGRFNNTPGFMSEQDKAGFNQEITPVQQELERLNKLSGADLLTENAISKANGQPLVADRIKSLQGKQAQIMQKYGIGRPDLPTPPAGQGQVDIPQPMASVATDQPYTNTPYPVNIGGIPGMTTASPQQLSQAIQSPAAPAQPSAPAPKAPRAAAPKSAPASSGGRPKVRIAPDGTIHVE